MTNCVAFSTTEFYPVHENLPVYLSLTIGEGNVGGSSVFWKNVLVKDMEGSFRDLPVSAQGSNMKNTLLACITRVKDINTSTNRTSLLVELKGGLKPLTFDFAVEVSQNGGYADYFLTFALV